MSSHLCDKNILDSFIFSVHDNIIESAREGDIRDNIHFVHTTHNLEETRFSYLLHINMTVRPVELRTMKTENGDPICQFMLKTHNAHTAMPPRGVLISHITNV